MKYKKILIADDEPNLRMSLSFILADAGYEATMVNNGQEALELILQKEKEAEPFDLLLTDIQMPHMTGLELIDALQSRNILLPVIVITGYGDKELVLELLRKGCCEYLDKPLTPDEVLKRVANVLARQEEFNAQWENNIRQMEEKQAELNREIESYQNNFSKLKEQVNSAVNVYRELVQLKKHGYKVKTVWRNNPFAELGGDFIDIQNTPTGCDILIADVAGHDMGASYHTILIKAFFDENCRTGKDGLEFFQLLNQQLLDKGENERMVTALFLRLNLQKMQGDLISAAHPFPIFLQKKANHAQTFTVSSSVLGLFEKAEFDIRTFPIAPGDRFLLHTDGISSAKRFNVQTKRKEKLNTDGLKSLFEQYQELSLENAVDQVWENILDFCEYKPHDDMLLVGLEIPEQPEIHPKPVMENVEHIL